MRAALLVFILLPGSYCDSRAMGYELGLFEVSLPIFFEELFEKKSGKVSFKPEYKKHTQESHLNPITFGTNDISFSRLVSTLCKIEGIWSLAKEQWILCLLSRSFTYMKLNHLIEPTGADIPLPPLGESNMKIYKKEVSFLKQFFLLYKKELWSSVILDTFFYFLQHILLILQKLLEGSSLTTLSTLSPPSPLFKMAFQPYLSFPQSSFPSAHSSTNTDPPKLLLTQSTVSPLSPLQNICNTLLLVLPKYFNGPVIHFFMSKQRNTGEKVFDFSHRSAKIRSLCSSARPAPLPSSSYSFNNTLLSSHSSLITATHTLLPSLFLTYHFYEAELSSLQDYLLSLHLSDSPLKRNASVTASTQSLLSIFESINLSLFSLTIICGPTSHAALSHYTLHQNLFLFLDTSFKPLQLLPKSLENNMINIALPWSVMQPSLTAIIELLLKVSQCAIFSYLDPLTRLKSESPYFHERASCHSSSKAHRCSDIMDEVEARKFDALKESIAGYIGSIQLTMRHMNSNKWDTQLSKWKKKKSGFILDWHQLSIQLVQLTRILNQWVDLEKVYKFPLLQILEKKIIPANKLQNADQSINQTLTAHPVTEVDAKRSKESKISNSRVTRSNYSLNPIFDFSSDALILDFPEVTTDSFFKIPEKFDNNEGKEGESMSPKSLVGLQGVIKSPIIGEMFIESEQRQPFTGGVHDYRQTGSSTIFPRNSLERHETHSREMALQAGEKVSNNLEFKIFDFDANLFEEADTFTALQVSSITPLSPILTPLPDILHNIQQREGFKTNFSPSLPQENESPLADNFSLDLSFPFFQLDDLDVTELIAGKEEVEAVPPVSSSPSAPFFTRALAPLSLHPTALSDEEKALLDANVYYSSIGGDTMQQEMQFWLLVNHHPSEISSCFTYSADQAKEDEVLNSSLSLPDVMSLYVSSNSLRNSKYQATYAWKEMGRRKDHRLEELLPITEFLLQRKWYNEKNTKESFYLFQNGCYELVSCSPPRKSFLHVTQESSERQKFVIYEWDKIPQYFEKVWDTMSRVSIF